MNDLYNFRLIKINSELIAINQRIINNTFTTQDILKYKELLHAKDQLSNI